MLRRRALSATAWSGADIILRQSLQFAVTIALARLLSPAEFGTIALLSLFTGIAGAFVDSGLSAALIQRQDTTQTDESTVFWFNLAAGVLVASALAASAGWIATFYNAPVLVSLVWVMAANVLLSALGAIHGTLLTKRLDFRTQMKIGGIASAISGGLAIWMALLGFGVWALACQTVAATILSTGLLWLMSPWRPTFEFSFVSARKLFGFGGFLLAAGLLDIVYSRLYTVFIGKRYGAEDLGYFNRAEGTKQLPVGVLTGILSRVAFPIFAEAKGDPARLRRGVRWAIRGIMLINLPMMLGLMAIAEPVVITLFGVKWLPSVPILKVLCVAGIFWPLHVININVLMAQGHSALLFRLEIVKKVIGIAMLGVGTWFGMIGIAWSMVAFGLFAFVVNSHYTRQFLGYGAWQQICDTAPILLLSVVMAGVVVIVANAWSPGPLIAAIGLSALGAVTFFSIGWIMRLQALHDILYLLRGKAAIQ